MKGFQQEGDSDQANSSMKPKELDSTPMTQRYSRQHIVTARLRRFVPANASLTAKEHADLASAQSLYVEQMWQRKHTLHHLGQRCLHHH
jgi:hypothetical protein